MKIDGKAIAAKIFEELAIRVTTLKQKGIIPHLVVILVGDDQASAAYVRQKDLKAQMIGAQATIIHLPVDITEEQLLATIQQYNNDNTIHGIIVQRPLPPHINSQQVNEITDREKDIDAFHKDSPFTMPLARAVLKILEYVYSCHPGEATTSIGSHTKKDSITSPHLVDMNVVSLQNDNFRAWLKSKSIVVIGKGETGGGPTIDLLKKLGVQPLIIDSKTENPREILKNADIIITTVGKADVIQAKDLKKDVILIGVGMYRGEDGKLHGDYEEDEIKDIASFYTPIPGGVGPVNVAMLLKNLIQAAH